MIPHWKRGEGKEEMRWMLETTGTEPAFVVVAFDKTWTELEKCLFTSHFTSHPFFLYSTPVVG